jgi:(acyl-carrier-protein) S-malonyltransferase
MSRNYLIASVPHAKLIGARITKNRKRMPNIRNESKNGSVAWRFSPGQGTQHVGMGSSLLQEFAAAKEVFSRTSSVLGIDMRRLYWEGLQRLSI